VREINLETALYSEQVLTWPGSGRYILAQYDEKSIIIYQAYNQSIGNFALSHGYFGGEFKFTRMSWIKTSFLWMMHRSRWATKPSQEIVLGVRLKLEFFNSVLKQAVLTSFDPDLYPNRKSWRTAFSRSQVRLQWDPDYDPSGNKLFRRAIQLGLRGDVLREYATEAIIEIIDMTEFIKIQRKKLGKYRRNISQLETPKEEVYMPKDEIIIKNIKLSL
jgi:hypothetical protein